MLKLFLRFNQVEQPSSFIRSIMKIFIPMYLFFMAGISFLPGKVCVQNQDAPSITSVHKKSIITGADQTEQYIGWLKGKRVGILANPTTIIGKKHLVDSLLSRGIQIVKIFGPEHG